jgi:hypothetical protein
MVGVFEVAAQWHSVCDSTDHHSGGAKPFGDVVRCGIPFGIRVGGEDDLADLAATHVIFKVDDPQIFGSNSLDG